MPVLSNAKHELFAVGLAKGLSADDAYGAAGYRPHRGNASTLRTKQNILDRVVELQARVARKLEVTVESLSAELDEVRVKAIAEKQFSAAVSATLGKAKLHGKLIDRKHLTGQIGTYDLTKVSDAQLDDLESILGPLADVGGDPSGEGETQH